MACELDAERRLRGQYNVRRILKVVRTPRGRIIVAEVEDEEGIGYATAVDGVCDPGCYWSPSKESAERVAELTRRLIEEGLEPEKAFIKASARVSQENYIRWIKALGDYR